MSEEGEALQLSHGDFRNFRDANLFNPFSPSLEHSKKQFETVQLIDKALSKFSWYQGLSVFGSTMFGYSRSDTDVAGEDGSSDIDIFILVDKGDATFPGLQMGRLLRSVTQDIVSEKNQEISIHGWVDVSRLYTNPPGGTLHASDVNLLALEALSFWSTQVGAKRRPGKILAWREKYKHFCSTLEPRVRETLRRRLVRALVDRDEKREPKIEKHIAGYKDASHGVKMQTLRARQALWSARVHQLFGL